MIVLPGKPDNVKDLGFHPTRLNREKKKNKVSDFCNIFIFTKTDQKIKSDMMNS